MTGTGIGAGGQVREVRDNAKGNTLGIVGHDALQDKTEVMIDCGKGRRAGQSERQDREEDRALR